MSKRKRWLKKRKRKGLLKPNSLVRGQCNAMGVTASPEKTSRIIRKSARYVDVLTICEAANVKVADVLGDSWEVAQDTSTPARAGSAIAVRKTRGTIKRWKIRIGVRAFLRGRRANRMRDRYIVRAVTRIDQGTKYRWTYKPAGSHGPPKRNWSIWWPAWMASVKTTPNHDFGADWNREQKVVKRWMRRRRVQIAGIDGFATKKWIPSSDVWTVDVGGDHPLVLQELWPN